MAPKRFSHNSDVDKLVQILMYTALLSNIIQSFRSQIPEEIPKTVYIDTAMLK